MLNWCDNWWQPSKELSDIRADFNMNPTDLIDGPTNQIQDHIKKLIETSIKTKMKAAMMAKFKIKKPSKPMN